MNARILVTGGAGFIGSHIVEALLADGAERVTVLDNFARGSAGNLAGVIDDSRLRLVVGDMRDAVLVESLVRDAEFVFHQAALRITQCAAEPAHAFEVMGTATFGLFELCAKYGVRRVVAASSASIYGMAPAFPTPEGAAPYADRTLYGGLKLLGESLLRALNDTHGLAYCALRYFNVFGPRMDVQGRYTEVLIRWMERIGQGEPPVIFGDGAQTMDFVDVRDVARANVAALHGPAANAAINIGTGREVSLRDLATVLLAAMGRPDLGIAFAPERAVNPVPRRLADTMRAREMLGFTSRITLEQGLRDLVDWWRAAGSHSLRRAA